jgi:aryl-alcohol dehydrogenase-like predicted oxidoreductase
MNLRPLAKTDLQISNLCLGGNVFGWSADERQSHEVLNLFTELGGNFIDTADVYSEWGEGHVGGESETVIGSWLKARASTDDVIIATKVSKLSTRPGLGRANILAACDDSLRRLGRDHIDLYYAHDDDQETPLEETMGAFTELQKAGKIRFAAASNYTGARLLEAAEVSRQNDFTEYVALQNHYNLLEREEYERDSVPVLNQLGIEGLPFFGLARGFLVWQVSRGRSGRVGARKRRCQIHKRTRMGRARQTRSPSQPPLGERLGYRAGLVAPAAIRGGTNRKRTNGRATSRNHDSRDPFGRRNGLSRRLRAR